PDDVIIQAVEDALKDGMDIVSFSLGAPALSGPLDIGVACQNDPGVPCDLFAQTFENATKAGVVVVAAGGNEGQDGNNFPTFNSIDSPGDAPSVIAVRAPINSQNAGTIAIFFYMADQSASVAPTGLSSFSIPAVMLSNSDGLALKNFIDTNPGHAATIDPAGIEQSSPSFNQVSFFSSYGPS